MSSFAKLAPLALVEFASEAFLNEIAQAVAQGDELNLVDDLVDEGQFEQQACLLLGDASLLHVEERRIVELPHRGAMRTFDVVGIDLEHRLGVHACLARGAEVLVDLLGGGFLGSVPHEHTSGKSTHRLVAHHILVELAAGAMGGFVVDERVVVHMLAFVAYHATIAEALGTLAVEREVEAIAGHSVVEGDDIVVDTAGALLVDIDIAHADVLVMGFLETIKVERSILTHVSLDDLRGEERTVVGRVVAEEKTGGSTFLNDDEDAAVDHEGGPSPALPV